MHRSPQTWIKQLSIDFQNFDIYFLSSAIRSRVFREIFMKLNDSWVSFHSNDGIFFFAFSIDAPNFFFFSFYIAHFFAAPGDDELVECLFGLTDKKKCNLVDFTPTISSNKIIRFCPMNLVRICEYMCVCANDSASFLALKLEPLSLCSPLLTSYICRGNHAGCWARETYDAPFSLRKLVSIIQCKYRQLFHKHNYICVRVYNGACGHTFVRLNSRTIVHLCTRLPPIYGPLCATHDCMRADCTHALAIESVRYRETASVNDYEHNRIGRDNVFPRLHSSPLLLPLTRLSIDITPNFYALTCFYQLEKFYRDSTYRDWAPS